MRRQPATIAATDYRSMVPCNLADQIGDAWQAMLGHLVPRRAEDPMVLDGVVYTALRFTRYVGYSCGRSHSPPEGSPADRLAAFGILILDYARADEPIQTGMMDRLRTTAGELAAVKPPIE